MLNTASYVESILMHYKAVYAYYRLIEFMGNKFFAAKLTCFFYFNLAHISDIAEVSTTLAK